MRAQVWATRDGQAEIAMAGVDMEYFLRFDLAGLEGAVLESAPRAPLGMDYVGCWLALLPSLALFGGLPVDPD